MSKPSNHPVLSLLPTQIVEKTWGHEEIYVNTDRFCGKKLVINAGHAFSLHYHKEKAEAFLLLSGRIMVNGVKTENGEHYSICMEPGDVLDVPVGAIHQVFALEPSEIIEFSTHHEDSDSYRIEKSTVS